MEGTGMTDGGLIDGKPVRNVGVCEKIFAEHDNISKECIKEAVAKGIPEEVAVLLANELKLMHRQMILGRNFDERPAFVPEEDWKKHLEQVAAPKKSRGRKNPKQRKEVRIKKNGLWI
jgi:hypothetical protein